MCQNSGSGMESAQIRKFVEHGMPEKIIKTVQYTLRKRAARLEQQQQQQQQQEQNEHHTQQGSVANVTYSSDSEEDDITKSKQTHTSAAATQSIPRFCGRFRKQQDNNHNNNNNNTNIQSNNIANIGATTGRPHSHGQRETTKAYVDALAVATQITKQFVQRFSGAVEKMQSSKIYTLLTKTTQPAHLIAVSVLTFVLFTVWPDIIGSRTSAMTATQKATIIANAAAAGVIDTQPVAPKEQHTLAVIAYLGAFATHFGAQIWMTFVSGLSLYFALPRHTFGQCQQILFPRYFALSSMLSISMLILFVKYFLNTWNVATVVQLSALAITAFIELMIRLYLAPPMLRLMHEKYRIEGAIGSGQEVGTLEQGDLIQCPHYQRIHKHFRRIHMTIAMGNMTVLLATCLHLYFLASKIQLS